jgi:hypothetical protein
MGGLNSWKVVWTFRGLTLKVLCPSFLDRPFEGMEKAIAGLP